MPRSYKITRRRKWRLPAPPALLAMLYFGLILSGTILLRLPVCTTEPLSFMDALFTATSAVTVTGLSVIDVGTHLTFSGQVVLAALIQTGGVGLMTFAVLLLSYLGVQVGLSSRQILREELNQVSTYEIMPLVKSVVRISLIVEGIGALFLAVVFIPEFGVVHGSWAAVFHAISAFNNAGFALWPDNLSKWVANPLINLAIPALIIIGGLGFVVIRDILTVRRWRLLSLHSKLMLVGTVFLILYGTVFFGALEWQNPTTLGSMDNWEEKALASWFQSVTTRTAGFNTVDIGQLHDSTSLLMISLMVVGGGSASTAGGIKVTTFMVLALSTLAFFKRSDVRAFGRTISHEQVLKVLALTSISILSILTGLFLVSISHDGDFLDLNFAVVSAFATTGLSRGATAELGGIGRVVVIFLMFVGRVGPLTLGFLLATRQVSRVRYPSGYVYLG